MINNNIRIDLHIHSHLSDYKDDPKIVKNSNIDNIDTLFRKLISHGIELFSITDHNRFNLKLYEKIDKILLTEEYKDKLNILAGVEFDVVLEKGKKAAHIVTIFDCKDSSDYRNIYEAIEDKKLIDKSEVYSKEEYELLLKSIGLNTILIVHQKKSLSNSSGRHASLSDSTSRPYEIIQIGYVDALEYQKPHVEGILKNNLRKIDKHISLITGSDCHDWLEYPKHSKNKKDFEGPFTTIKALATFKGLHISLTSPKTRINRILNENSTHIESFLINDKLIRLDPGINAIIGENGSGKSTILSMLANNLKYQYVKKLIDHNNIKRNFKGSNDKIKYIAQSEIVEKYNKDKLFSDSGDYFADIDNKTFIDSYSVYTSELKKVILKNIEINQVLSGLKNYNFEFTSEHNIKSYFVSFQDYENDSNNVHSKRKVSLKSIIELLIQESKLDYYKKNNRELIVSEVIDKLYSLYQDILTDMLIADNENSIKNLISSEISSYKTSISPKMSTKEGKATSYNTKKQKFVNQIVAAVSNTNIDNKLPGVPKPVSGFSKNRKYGFEFNKESKYNNRDMMPDYLQKMFNKDYQSIESLLKITSKTEFVNAVTGANIDTFDSKWDSNYKSFIENAISTKKYILEASVNNNIGNTMGELSIAYYKYHLQEDEEVDVFLLDQPEDNISNTKIVEELINYLNSLRHEKQLIFVTHNPLLVVNLDVDNVICLEKINNNINVINGCIENETNNIIEHISSKMEGGKEMIEKRLKIYG